MIIRLIKQPNNSILATGRSDSAEGSAVFRQEIQVDASFMNITFSELEKLLWLETDDSGELISRKAKND